MIGFAFSFKNYFQAPFSDHMSPRHMFYSLDTSPTPWHVIYRDFSALKIEISSEKKNDFFFFFCSKQGGSNEYPQSMFLTKNKSNRYTPAYPSFSI